MTTQGKKNNRTDGPLFPSLLTDFFNNSFLGSSLADLNNEFINRGAKIPPANFSETTDAYHIELSAPGLRREDFKVEMEDGAIVVSAEKKEENNNNNENYHRREFAYSSFYRRFELPENIAEEVITAKYDNGMLYITIPKKELTVKKPKKKIQVS